MLPLCYTAPPHDAIFSILFAQLLGAPKIMAKDYMPRGLPKYVFFLEFRDHSLKFQRKSFKAKNCLSSWAKKYYLTSNVELNNRQRFPKVLKARPLRQASQQLQEVGDNTRVGNLMDHSTIQGFLSDPSKLSHFS